MVCLAGALLDARSGAEQAELEEVMNAALRVADELSGCDSNRSSGYALWSSALTALHRRGRALDSENLERLFWRDNRHVRCSALNTTRLLASLIFLVPHVDSVVVSICLFKLHIDQHARGFDHTEGRIPPAHGVYAG